MTNPSSTDPAHSSEEDQFELGPQTRFVVRLSSAVGAVVVLVGAALWADDVSDSLRSIDRRLSEMDIDVNGLDSITVRRSTMNAWLRELRSTRSAWAAEVKLRNPDIDLPPLVFPELPVR